MAEASSFIFLLVGPGNQACHHCAVHYGDTCMSRILLNLSKQGGTCHGKNGPPKIGSPGNNFLINKDPP